MSGKRMLTVGEARQADRMKRKERFAEKPVRHCECGRLCNSKYEFKHHVCRKG